MRKNEKYNDVTKEWLNKERPKTNRIIIDKMYVDRNTIKHPIKNLEAVFIASKNSDEYKIAIILRNTFGGIIHMPPRIIDISNTGISTPTPDYIWNNEKWDLKTPKYKEKYMNLFNDLLKKNRIKYQSQRFIIDLKHFSKIDEKDIRTICKRLFNNNYRKWVKEIIIIKKEEVYTYLIRK